MFIYPNKRSRLTRLILIIIPQKDYYFMRKKTHKTLTKTQAVFSYPFKEKKTCKNKKGENFNPQM